MQIEKIKAIKPDFHEGCGPSETVTLGFKCGENTYLLGTFYYGHGMNNDAPKEAEKLEALIDHIVKASNQHHSPDGESSVLFRTSCKEIFSPVSQCQLVVFDDP